MGLVAAALVTAVLTATVLGGSEVKRTAVGSTPRELVITGTVLLSGLEVRGPKQKKRKKGC